MTKKSRLLEKICDAVELLREAKDLDKINLTDPDAPIMKGKKGDFNTNYNGQLACSEDQIISYCDVVTAGNDKAQLVPALKGVAINTGKTIKIALADADYGTYDSIEYMHEEGICGYVPYRDMNSTFDDKPYHRSHFQYDHQRDLYRCPANQKLEYIRTFTDKRRAQNFRLYRTAACKGCPFQSECCPKREQKRKINREVRQDLRDEMKQRLNSEEGKKMYGRRMHPVEAIFGHVKYNLGYTQFLLRGLEKVKAEFTLICLTHNLRKLANHLGISHIWLIISDSWRCRTHKVRCFYECIFRTKNTRKSAGLLCI